MCPGKTKRKKQNQKKNGEITAQQIAGGEAKNVVVAFKYSNI